MPATKTPAQLVLTIGGTFYVVAPAPVPDGFRWAWTLSYTHLRTGNRLIYTVCLSAAKSMRCTCPSAKFRQPDAPECKHIQGVRDNLDALIPGRRPGV